MKEKYRKAFQLRTMYYYETQLRRRYEISEENMKSEEDDILSRVLAQS